MQWRRRESSLSKKKRPNYVQLAPTAANGIASESYLGIKEREELSNTSNTLPILRSPPIRQPRRAKPDGSHEFLVPFPGSNLQSREFIFRASGTKHNQFDLFLFTCFAARRSIRRSRRFHKSRLRETQRFSTDSASLYPIPFLAI